MEDNGFIGFLAGSCFISIGHHDAVKGRSKNPERIIFFFETKEVEAEYARITKIDGAEAIKEPYKPNPNGDFWLATIADPDGNYFQLASPWDA